MDRPRVLYIDDDHALARLIERSLSRAGYDMEHAPTGESGLARVLDGGIDVIALDHHLTGETGLEVLKRLTALPSRPPVVYVTGSEDSRVAVAALKGGAVDYVWKDVQGHFRELLVEAVAGAIEKEQLRVAKEAADRAVLEARDRAELMLKEVNHRVSNSLAMVAGFARLQAGVVSDPAARQALEEMQARIHAIAGVHRRLYTSDDVQSVELDAYLDHLLEELRAGATSGHRITLDADPLKASPDKAVSIGIIVTELVTNALKYAYLPGHPGDVRVKLKSTPAGACLMVEDDGVGWQGGGDVKGTGLGMRVISAMATNLRSKLEYHPAANGARAALNIAL